MPFNPQNMFVIHASLMSHTVGGKLRVSVFEVDAIGYACTNMHGSPVNCRIVAAPGVINSPNDHVEDVDIFWCGYAQDSIQFSVLSGTSGPGIMLTPTMDGCTFGIGHSARDGTCLVTHANNASGQHGIDDIGTMAVDQRTATKGLFRQTGQKLKYTMQPNDYRWADEGQGRRMIASASTFGVRNNNHWRFYRHKYLLGMGDYTFIDTKRVK